MSLAPSKTALTYSLSLFFERASFWGIRSLFFIFFMENAPEMTTGAMQTIILYLGIGLAFTGVLGGLIGDLALGNRKTMLLGALLSVVGTSILSLMSPDYFMIGLGILVLGSGFFGPNLRANFGKTYLDRISKMDAGFSFMHFAMYSGGFVGTALTNMIANAWSTQHGFIFAAFLGVLAFVALLFSKELKVDDPVGSEKKENHLPSILVVTLMLVVFWGVYEISNVRISEIAYSIQADLSLPVGIDLLFSMGSIAPWFFLLLGFVIWSYVNLSSFIKILLGFIFGAIALPLLYFIPPQAGAQHALLFVGGVTLIGLAEALISPSVHSIITELSRPKFLAIAFGLLFLAVEVFVILIRALSAFLELNTLLALEIGMGGMFIFGYWYFQILKGPDSSSSKS